MLFNAIKLKCRQLNVVRYTSSRSNTRHVHKSLSSESIRNTFLDYFIDKQGHQLIRSSSVVPYCDPTVPFVNAGMNQFKNIFLSDAVPPSRTAVNSQKCIRVGGKHNDLNVVGTDGYHHTFFEMLGNWSFGDYFKDRACRMAWELLTNEYGIHPTRLYVTYFSGNKALGIGADIECKEIWRQIGVPADRILPYGMQENFWEMGPIGPCGPCTEIHIDHLPNSSPSTRAQYVNAGRPDLTELWNLVFIQYLRNADGSVSPLKRRHIDTGMGFERLVAILQNKSSNYDTDLFLPIFDAVAKAARVAPYGGTFDKFHSTYELDVAYRVLADHARMCTICIADGMFPERNYRLRRVFRKAINISDNVFKTPNILEETIIPQIVHTLGATYPELEKNYEQILKVVSHEASTYRSLLTKSAQSFRKLNLRSDSPLTEVDALEYPGLMRALRDIDKQLKSDPKLNSLSPENLYYLHTTYGLDEDALERVALEKRLTVRMDEFTEYLVVQRELAKQKLALDETPIAQALKRQQLPKTNDRFKYFYEYDAIAKRYDLPTVEAKVLFVGRDDATELCHIVLDKTNFYAVAGGQDSDVGTIVAKGTNRATVFEVEMVELNNDVVVHSGRFVDGARGFGVGDTVSLCVDSDRRTSLTQHHTGTHLMQAAIRYVTKKVIYQKSSHVSAECIKFDLGIIGDRLTSSEIADVEELIRNIIKKPLEVKTDLLAAHELYACDRITTVPGAVYPENDIQVLRIEDTPSGFVSLEPCCGTHVRTTSEVENFCITAIRSTKSGTFEITAVCGERAQQVCENGKNALREMEELRAGLQSAQTESELHEIIATIRRMKGSLRDNQVPFTIKESTSKELETIDKPMNVKLRDTIRKWITREMSNVMADCQRLAEPVVVHIIESAVPLEFILMRDAMEISKQFPTILFNTSNGRVVSSRASVPIQVVSERFDARIWLKETLAGVGISIDRGKCRIKSDCSVFDLRDISSGRTVDTRELGGIQARAKSIFEKYI